MEISRRRLRKYIQKVLSNYIVFGNSRRIRIAKTAVVNNALFNTVGGNIIIEDWVALGHSVSVLTGTHDIKLFNQKRHLGVPKIGRDIIIKEGAWIASNATIIGPCVIGEHSVVAACSLVNKIVPPYVVVAGVPAKIIKIIPH